MYIRNLVGIGILCIVTLSACDRVPHPAPSNRTSALPKRCVSYTELYGQGIDLYRTRQSLDQKTLADLGSLLSKAGLSPLQSLHDVGGTEYLTSDLCRWLYDEYNARTDQNLPNESCLWNLQSDQQHFTEYGVPLVIQAWHLDDRYIFLSIGEEGLGGKLLFSFLYQPETDTLMSVDTTQLNALPEVLSLMQYYDNQIHYYQVSESYPGVEQNPCAGTKIAIFDLETGQLSF